MAERPVLRCLDCNHRLDEAGPSPLFCNEDCQDNFYWRRNEGAPVAPFLAERAGTVYWHGGRIWYEAGRANGSIQVISSELVATCQRADAEAYWRDYIDRAIADLDAIVERTLRPRFYRSRFQAMADDRRERARRKAELRRALYQFVLERRIAADLYGQGAAMVWGF